MGTHVRAFVLGTAIHYTKAMACRNIPRWIGALGEVFATRQAVKAGMRRPAREHFGQPVAKT
jgi:hypothetical protein